ncbi:hypothetical protein Pelo_14687 [Pelomyxa schiedti]|nr:hypothetical protein Pelo_14687 [Pelomyxa schiedti]
MSSFYVLGNCVAELGREGETILAAESKMYARLRLATISGWKVLRGGGGGYGGKSSGTQQASQGQSQVQAGQKVIVVEFDYPPLESELKTQDGLNDQKLVEEFWNLMTGQQQARPLEAQLQIIASQHQSVMQQIQQKQVALQTSHQNQAPQSELQQISQAISQLKSSAMSLDAENLRIRQRIQDFHNALPLKIVDPSAASASADSNSAAPPPVGKFEAVVTTVVPNYQSYGLPSDYTLKHAAVQYAKLIMDTNS